MLQKNGVEILNFSRTKLLKPFFLILNEKAFDNYISPELQVEHGSLQWNDLPEVLFVCLVVVNEKKTYGCVVLRRLYG